MRLESDTGQFEVQSLDTEDWEVTPVDCSLLRSDRDSLYVLTGSQWGPFRVEFDVLAGEPPTGSSWDDIAEAGIWTSSGLALSEVPPGEVVELTRDRGFYQLRVSASGRKAARAADRASAERYLIEIWPVDPGSQSARILVGCGPLAAPQLRADQLPSHARAMAGAAAIGQAIDDGPIDSPQLGSTSVEAVLPLRQTDTYVSLRVAVGLGFGIAGLMEEAGFSWARPTTPGDPEAARLVGSHGSIWMTPLEIRRPRLARINFGWKLPGPGADPHDHLQLVSVLREPTIKTTETRRLDPKPDGTPQTFVRITHEGLPVEWTEPMEAWWAFLLEMTEAWS